MAYVGTETRAGRGAVAPRDRCVVAPAEARLVFLAVVSAAVLGVHEGLRGRDEEGAELLKKAMAIEPDNADVRYALGLLLVRRHDYAAALDLLRRAHELMPDNARCAYVYAVAVNSSGEAREASRLALSDPLVGAGLEERVKAALRTLLRD